MREWTNKFCENIYWYIKPVDNFDWIRMYLIIIVFILILVNLKRVYYWLVKKIFKVEKMKYVKGWRKINNTK